MFVCVCQIRIHPQDHSLQTFDWQRLSDHLPRRLHQPGRSLEGVKVLQNRTVLDPVGVGVKRLLVTREADSPTQRPALLDLKELRPGVVVSGADVRNNNFLQEPSKRGTGGPSHLPHVEQT